jgi:hypothetical protein
LDGFIAISGEAMYMPIYFIFSKKMSNLKFANQIYIYMVRKETFAVSSQLACATFGTGYIYI